MSFKLALLLLFGFVALAVAVPLEDTEDKAEPAEPVAADTEKPEAPLEESEADESEEENQEDAEEEPEEDDNEDEPENEVEAKEEDDANDKRGRFAATVCRYLRGGVCYRKKKCYRRRVGRSTEYCCRVGPRVCRAKYMKACVLCWRCRNRHYRPRLICRRRKVCRKYICHYLPYCICPCHYRG